MHEYEFEVEAVIDAEIDTVFNAILDVNSYHNWFPGVEKRSSENIDPEIRS